jgi:hypothetical protein
MQTLRITVKVTFSSPVSHEQEERSRLDYGPEMAARGTRCRPAEPDAGPLIKAGFYRADQTMVDLGVYHMVIIWPYCWRYSTYKFTDLAWRSYTRPRIWTLKSVP